MPQGKQVKLFLVDGTSGGLLTAQITNWTGHVLKGPRRDVQRIRQRPEAARTGVYILLGPDPDTADGTLAYIGQTDEIAKRLGQHDADSKKEFFREVIVITSNDENLTSAHVRFLEARLISIASKINRTRLLNANAATQVQLPEGDISDMEYFIEQLRMILPVLGVNLFRGREKQEPASAFQGKHGETPDSDGLSAPEHSADNTIPPVHLSSMADSPVFHLKLARGKVDATAQVVDGEFTVLKGSRARAAMVSPKADSKKSTAMQHELRKAEHTELINDGTLYIQGDIAIFTRDRVFSSPSAAAALVCGRGTANGRIEWKTANGINFGSWESDGSITAADHS